MNFVDPRPFVDTLRDQPHQLPASHRNGSRALLLFEALAWEAVRRSHQVRAGKAATPMSPATSIGPE